MLALTRTTSLLEKPNLSVLMSKNTLRPGDRHRLNKVKKNDLFDNIMHSHGECPLCVYGQRAKQGSEVRVWGSKDEKKTSCRGMLEVEDSG